MNKAIKLLRIIAEALGDTITLKKKTKGMHFETRKKATITPGEYTIIGPDKHCH